MSVALWTFGAIVLAVASVGIGVLLASLFGRSPLELVVWPVLTGQILYWMQVYRATRSR